MAVLLILLFFLSFTYIKFRSLMGSFRFRHLFLLLRVVLVYFASFSFSYPFSSSSFTRFSSCVCSVFNLISVLTSIYILSSILLSLSSPSPGLNLLPQVLPPPLHYTIENINLFPLFPLLHLPLLPLSLHFTFKLIILF